MNPLPHLRAAAIMASLLLSAAAQAPVYATLQVSPAASTGVCPAQLTVTLTLSSTQSQAVTAYFYGEPVLNQTYWVSATRPSPGAAMHTGGAPLTFSARTSSSGWVQADIVKPVPLSPGTQALAFSKRVYYTVQCPHPSGNSATTAPRPGTAPVYPQPGPSVNVPPPASRPPATSPPAPVPVPPLTPQQKAELARRQSQAQANLQQSASAQQQTFLRYKAQFQMRELDAQAARVNALARRADCGAGCQSAVQAHLAASTQLRAQLQSTLHPVADLMQSLRSFRGAVNPSTGPAGQNSGPDIRKKSGSGTGSACVAPQITAMNIAQGQPGDMMILTGTDLANAQNPAIPPAIIFKLGGAIYQTGVEYSSDSQIITTVPELPFPGHPGLPTTQGFMFVTTCQQSNAETFTFIPQTDVELLPISQSDAIFSNFSCSPDICDAWQEIGPIESVPAGMAADVANGGMFVGKRGTDSFFYGYQLRNGWVLDSVSFNFTNGNDPGVPDSNNGCSYSNQIGSTSPYTSVGCWVSAGGLGYPGIAGYLLGIYIHGPLGVPWQ